MSNKNLIALAAVLILASCSSNKSSQSNNSAMTQAEVIIATAKVSDINSLPATSKSEEERTVFFDTNDSNLKSEHEEILSKKVVAWMNANPELKVIVEGHCDERGAAPYNKKLGKKRAQAVRNYLVANGIKSSRIKTVSYGFSSPLDNSHNESAWQKNRRAVTISVQ